MEVSGEEEEQALRTKLLVNTIPIKKITKKFLAFEEALQKQKHQEM
jgi:hypothetical protein